MWVILLQPRPQRILIALGTRMILLEKLQKKTSDLVFYWCKMQKFSEANTYGI